MPGARVPTTVLPSLDSLLHTYIASIFPGKVQLNPLQAQYHIITSILHYCRLHHPVPYALYTNTNHNLLGRLPHLKPIESPSLTPPSFDPIPSSESWLGTNYPGSYTTQGGETLHGKRVDLPHATMLVTSMANQALHPLRVDGAWTWQPLNTANHIIAKIARFFCCSRFIHRVALHGTKQCKFHSELDGWSGSLVSCCLLFLTHSSFHSPWGSWSKKKKKKNNFPPWVAQNFVPNWRLHFRLAL